MEPSFEKIGRITHFFSKAGVAIIELTAPVKKGDKIVIRGSTTSIEQTIDSMEIEHKQIPKAAAGQSIGLSFRTRT
jgi:putative protease